MSSMDVDSASGSGSSSVVLSNFEYCLAEAQRYKEAGNEALKAGQYQLALGKYLKVQGCTAGLQLPAGLMQSQEISMLASGRQKPSLTGDQQQTLAAFLVTVHLNMAQAYLKLQQWSKVVDMSTRVLQVDGRNAKALFRRGTALLHGRHLKEAIADLTMAAQLVPTDALIAQTLAHAQKIEHDEEQQAERKLRHAFSGMFSGGGQQ